MRKNDMGNIYKLYYYNSHNNYIVNLPDKQPVKFTSVTFYNSPSIFPHPQMPERSPNGLQLVRHTPGKV